MKRKEAGLSLIEVLAVTAIAAITLTLGIPSFAEAMRRQRLATTLHLLSADMAMARSTALMRRSQVVVCPRGSGSGCSGEQDWSAGWMVFLDADGDFRPDRDADLLRVTDPPTSDRALLYLPASRPHLRYRTDGRSVGSNLSVHVCARGGHHGKVVVSNAGRVRSERGSKDTPCRRD